MTSEIDFKEKHVKKILRGKKKLTVRLSDEYVNTITELNGSVSELVAYADMAQDVSSDITRFKTCDFAVLNVKFHTVCRIKNSEPFLNLDDYPYKHDNYSTLLNSLTKIYGGYVDYDDYVDIIGFEVKSNRLEQYVNSQFKKDYSEFCKEGD